MKKINIYSTKNINLISIIITVIIILILNLFINNYSKKNAIEIKNEKTISEKMDEKENNKKEKNQDEKLGDWYIEIEKINLKAPIKETTDMDVLNTAVGHFEETPVTIGNIGLAGHNRGYEKNYFEKLKDVKNGYEIKYKYKNYEEIYIVDKIKIIKDTDWSYLKDTKNNKITLITCVENKPNNRLCVQATKK